MGSTRKKKNHKKPRETVKYCLQRRRNLASFAAEIFFVVYSTVCEKPEEKKPSQTGNIFHICQHVRWVTEKKKIRFYANR